MKTLHIVLLAVIAAGVIGLIACTDAVSTDDEVNPLADDEDKVYGTVYDNQNPPQPVADVWVLVFKREKPTDPWSYIDEDQTNFAGQYEFHIDPWPAGWDGKVDCTYDDVTAHAYFGYPEEGPVEADIYF
jgi:hypothetical protein